MILSKAAPILISVSLVFSVLSAQTPAAVQMPISKYGVPVIKDILVYQSTVKTDSNKQMVELKSIIPTLVYELKYASDKNFVHHNMYPIRTTYTFLRLPVARALAEVQKDLAEKGMGLKIWDAYRPYSVTEKFWEWVMDERYVADPKKASGHNRGLAVDVTVIYLHDKKNLQMPTDYDNFSDTAHLNFMNLPFDALQNRKMLSDVMQKHGFVKFDTEWWHFSWPDPKNYYEAMDVDFKDLRDAK